MPGRAIPDFGRDRSDRKFRDREAQPNWNERLQHQTKKAHSALMHVVNRKTCGFPLFHVYHTVGDTMPITIALLPSNVDDSGSNLLYAIGTLAFSGNYPTAGDTLDFTQSLTNLPTPQHLQP